MKDGILIVIAKDAKTVVQIDGVYSSLHPMDYLKDLSQYWIEKNQPNHAKKLRSYICKITAEYLEPKGTLPGLTKTGNYLDMNLSELELDTRSYNALMGERNIKFVGDVVRLSDAELLRIPNLGRRSLNDIRAKIKLAKSKALALNWMWFHDPR